MGVGCLGGGEELVTRSCMACGVPPGLPAQLSPLLNPLLILNRSLPLPLLHSWLTRAWAASACATAVWSAPRPTTSRWVLGVVVWWTIVLVGGWLIVGEAGSAGGCSRLVAVTCCPPAFPPTLNHHSPLSPSPHLSQVSVMDFAGAGGWLRLAVDNAGGRAAVASVAVKGASGDWQPLHNSWGATWEAAAAPAPPLSFRVSCGECECRVGRLAERMGAVCCAAVRRTSCVPVPSQPTATPPHPSTPSHRSPMTAARLWRRMMW